MSPEDEEKISLSNNCWICDKLINIGENKVGVHFHKTEKYRGSEF